jgi:pimeloyl-ACP methyl ester carboxylesterase
VIYLPGIMGSELADDRGEVVWGMKPSLVAREAIFGNVLRRLIPRPGDGIHATRPVQWPVSLPLLSAMEPYAALERRLRQTVVRPEAVKAFAYDWRLSIADAAGVLAPVARAHLAAWREMWRRLPADDQQGQPEPKLTFVCHSMGGLVASHFAAFGDDGGLVRRVITLGTPFRGSLNAVRALGTGEQLPGGLFATALRDAVRTMPGVYELVARWDAVVETRRRRIEPKDLAGIGADAALAEQAFAVTDRLYDALKSGRVRFRSLVGTTQPTRQAVRFARGTASFEEALDGVDDRGDGTVFRFSAVPPDVDPAYLPQSHGAVAKTAEAIEFVAAVLTERRLGAAQAPPGVGLRIPDIVKPGEPFTVSVLDARPGVACTVHDAEDNRLITAAVARKQDDEFVATVAVPKAGLYRVSASGGGYSAVEQLVSAISD